MKWPWMRRRHEPEDCPSHCWHAVRPPLTDLLHDEECCRCGHFETGRWADGSGPRPCRCFVPMKGDVSRVRVSYPKDATFGETTYDASVPPPWSCGHYVFVDVELTIPVTEDTVFAIPKWLKAGECPRHGDDQ